MKKVITMVGTSIFENYMKEKEDKTFSTYIDDVKDKNSDDYKNEKNRIDYIKGKLKQ
jgi:hypothetical protein